MKKTKTMKINKTILPLSLLTMSFGILACGPNALLNVSEYSYILPKLNNNNNNRHELLNIEGDGDYVGSLNIDTTSALPRNANLALGDKFIESSKTYSSNDNGTKKIPIKFYQSNENIDRYKTFNESIKNGALTFWNELFGTQPNSLAGNLNDLTENSHQIVRFDTNNNTSKSTISTMDWKKLNNKRLFFSNNSSNFIKSNDTSDFLKSLSNETDFIKSLDNFKNANTPPEDDRIVIVSNEFADTFNHNIPKSNALDLLNGVPLNDPFQKSGVGFIMLGDYAINDRVISLMTREDQLGFLLGLSTSNVANIKTNRNNFYVSGNTIKVGILAKNNHINDVGSLSGFQQGVNFFNKVIQPKLKDSFPIEIVLPEIAREVFVENVRNAKNLVRYYHSRGARLIYGSLGFNADYNITQSIIDTMRSLQGTGVNNVYRGMNLILSSEINNDKLTRTDYSLNNVTLNVSAGQTTNRVVLFNGVKKLTHSITNILRATNLNFWAKKYQINYDDNYTFGFLNMASYKNYGLSLSSEGLLALLDATKNWLTAMNQSETARLLVKVSDDDPNNRSTANISDLTNINSTELINIFKNQLDSLDNRLFLTNNWNKPIPSNQNLPEKIEMREASSSPPITSA